MDPFLDLTNTPETVDPDGNKGLQWQESGIGWSSMCQRGIRDLSNGQVFIVWRSPYGGTFHQLAGFPMKAVWSRVEVYDSQSTGRFAEGEPEPVVAPPRRRWELPWNEIIHRGVASDDLPAWLHARPERRLALVPVVGGFVLDTTVYALAYVLAASFCAAAWRWLHPDVQGFPVVIR